MRSIPRALRLRFAELVYQAKPTRETLESFKDVVLGSAEFMASYPHWNAERRCYELRPPSVAPYENDDTHLKASKKRLRPNREICLNIRT